MIAQNLEIIESKILSACLKAGRDRNDVKLVAVSKTHPVSEIRKAIELGLDTFGENKAQEFSQKVAEIKDLVDWHFIGHLQTNKVKYIIEKSNLIHSVESLKLAKQIDKKAEQFNKIQNILIEINSAGETSKFGLFDYDDVLKLIEDCGKLKNINVVGLMTMAPNTEDEKVIRMAFSKVRDFKNKLAADGVKLKELSMGMSNDFEIAIEEGSTIIRVGTALFGGRNYS